MTREELENHLRDIIEDSRNPIMPLDLAIKHYAATLYESINNT